MKFTFRATQLPADNAEIKVRINYLALWIGIPITIIGSFVVAVCIKNVDTKDVVAVFTAGIVCTTLSYHAMNYHLNYEVNRMKFEFDDNKLIHDKKVVALNIISEWNKPEMTKIANTLKLLFDDFVGKKNSEFIQKIQTEADVRFSVIAILNYFEKIGAAVSFEVADENLLKDYFLGLVNGFWHGLNEYIIVRRKEREDDDIFIQFEQLYKKWNFK
jgi:Domain of unknown function (DUF4760)